MILLLLRPCETSWSQRTSIAQPICKLFVAAARLEEVLAMFPASEGIVEVEEWKREPVPGWPAWSNLPESWYVHRLRSPTFVESVNSNHAGVTRHFPALMHFGADVRTEERPDKTDSRFIGTRKWIINNDNHPHAAIQSSSSLEEQFQLRYREIA